MPHTDANGRALVPACSPSGRQMYDRAGRNPAVRRSFTFGQRRLPPFLPDRTFPTGNQSGWVRCMPASSISAWVVDRHPIFRRGLCASLAAEGIAVVGESDRLDAPPPDSAQVLVFEADQSGLRGTQLNGRAVPHHLAIVNGADERLISEIIEVGVTAIHLRTEIEPASLARSVRAVVDGRSVLPAQVLQKLLERAANGASHGVRHLTERELSVLGLLADGNDTSDIAGELCYSERTVKNIVHDVLMKMNCRNRAHAVALATRQGII